MSLASHQGISWNTAYCKEKETSCRRGAVDSYQHKQYTFLNYCQGFNTVQKYGSTSKLIKLCSQLQNAQPVYKSLHGRSIENLPGMQFPKSLFLDGAQTIPLNKHGSVMFEGRLESFVFI